MHSVLSTVGHSCGGKPPATIVLTVNVYVCQLVIIFIVCLFAYPASTTCVAFGTASMLWDSHPTCDSHIVGSPNNHNEHPADPSQRQHDDARNRPFNAGDVLDFYLLDLSNLHNDNLAERNTPPSYIMLAIRVQASAPGGVPS